MARNLIPILQQAGFRGPALRNAWAIAQRESGGNPRAFNPNAGTGDRSYGLFQINMLGNLGPARRKQYGLASNEELFDPETNARVAYRMSGGGKDWGPWGIGPNAYAGSSDATRSRFQQLLSQFPGAGAAGPPPAPGDAGAPANAFASRMAATDDNGDAFATNLINRILGGSKLTPQTLLSALGSARASTPMDRPGSRLPQGENLPYRPGSATGPQAGIGENLPYRPGGQGFEPAVQASNLGPYGLGKYGLPPLAREYTPLGIPFQGTHSDIPNWQSQQAWDLGVPVGTPIYAPAAGTIDPNRYGALDSSSPRMEGLRLNLENTPTGEDYYLAHLSKLIAKPGARVKAGQLLGLSGEAAGTPHLHYAVSRL